MDGTRSYCRWQPCIGSLLEGHYHAGCIAGSETMLGCHTSLLNAQRSSTCASYSRGATDVRHQSGKSQYDAPGLIGRSPIVHIEARPLAHVYDPQIVESHAQKCVLVLVLSLRWLAQHHGLRNIDGKLQPQFLSFKRFCISYTMSPSDLTKW